MISVGLDRTESGIRLTARGHAGYSSKGSDIVCAAVSSIFISLSLTLDELSGRGLLSVSENLLDEGMFRCVIGEEICGVLPLLDAINGIEYLAGRYPDCVSLTGVENCRMEMYERLPALAAGLKGKE